MVHRSVQIQQHTTEAAAIAPELAAMDVAMLGQRAAAESERFYRGQPHDTSFSYELFRRAILLHSETAWTQIFQLYSPLVDSWIRRSSAFVSSGETSEFFVTQAFTRFWKAITPERFTSFTSLAALLQYLQMCAGCVVIDSVRTQSWAEVLPETALPAVINHSYTTPDEEAMERVSREEFWTYINGLLSDESERVVVYSSYVLGMKPGDIYEQRPDLFDNVNDVYNVKRNVLGRLSRNQELRRMLML